MAETPFLGAGLSFRPCWRWDAVRHREELGVVETIAEELLWPDALRDHCLLRDVVPVLVHGLGLSLGSASGLDPVRVAHLARVVDAIQPPWFSEHVAFTRAGDLDVGHLMPLPFTAEAVNVVVRNVETVRAAIPNVPFLLENIAYLLRLPGAEMSEAEFLCRILSATDCGLLLDLENVHANACNHGYDPFVFLSSLPLDRVVEVHLAGGVWREGRYADTHTRPVPPESWELLRWLAPRTPICAVVIERDEDLPSFAELLDEVRVAAEILEHAA